MRILILTAAFVLGAAPAFANPAKPPKPAKGSPEEVVCHREEVTGSLAQTRKTCRTRAQWTAQAELAQRDATARDENSRINSEAPR